MQTLKLGLVTDIHAGVERSNIKSGEAMTLLEDVVAGANREKVDLLVTLGDNVNATDVEADILWLSKVREALDRSNAPTVPLFGNNEFKFLGRERAAQALGCQPTSEMRSLNGWSLLFWRPDCSLSLEDGYVLQQEDLDWLEAALEKATYPAVVFLHALIDEHSMVGNFYFANCPRYSAYSNAAAARRILEASGKVVMVLTGHVHWNAGSTIDGIHYRTISSLPDTPQAGARPSAAWATLELGADGWLSLEVFGREPMRWAAPMRTEKTHWRASLTNEGYLTRMRRLWSGQTA